MVTARIVAGLLFAAASVFILCYTVVQHKEINGEEMAGLFIAAFITAIGAGLFLAA